MTRATGALLVEPLGGSIVSAAGYCQGAAAPIGNSTLAFAVADAIGTGVATGDCSLNAVQAAAYSQGTGGERLAVQAVISGVFAGATATGVGVGVGYVITPATAYSQGAASNKVLTPDLNVMGTGADEQGSAFASAGAGAATGFVTQITIAAAADSIGTGALAGAATYPAPVVVPAAQVPLAQPVARVTPEVSGVARRKKQAELEAKDEAELLSLMPHILQFIESHYPKGKGKSNGHET